MTGYHVTPKANVPSILEHGLLARNTMIEGEGHYAHAYLSGNNLRAVFFHLDYYAACSWRLDYAPYIPAKDKVIIEVDLRGLKTERDPEWSGAVRTRRSVHPKRIRHIYFV